MGLGFFSSEDGITTKDLDFLTRRNTFSKYLPIIAYDPDTLLYTNGDDTQGFMWECSPLYFAGGQSMEKLEGIFRLRYPENSVLQFILFGDSDISHILEHYAKTKTRQNKVVQGCTKSFIDFLQLGTEGLEAMNGIPVRSFRLFCTLKFPNKKKDEGTSPKDLHSSITETLHGVGLCPQPLLPREYLTWHRKFFNDHVAAHRFLDPDGELRELIGFWERGKEIRHQIINAETKIEKQGSILRVGKKSFKCLTPKSLPKRVSPIQTNQIFGEIDGPPCDSNQIISPFMYTMNIVFQDVGMKLHGKANFLMTQGTIASLAPSLGDKQKEYGWAMKEVEAKVPFVRVMPILWVWEKDDSVRSISQSFARARNMCESQRYLMQEEDILLTPLFIAAQPFGLYVKGTTLDDMERDFLAPASAVVPTLPIQGDFSGGGIPQLLFVGRKGQIQSLDIFNKNAINYNSFTAAGSGAGKSFFVNDLCAAYYGSGAKIRIIDIGGSYKKSTLAYGAKYIEFNQKSDVCLNPFTNIGTGDIPPEDKEEIFQMEISSIASLVMQMAFSATGQVPTGTDAETCMTLIKDGIVWAWGKHDNDACIDHIHHFLTVYPEEMEGFQADMEENTWSRSAILDRSRLAHNVAYNLRDFTSKGPFGRWFNGKSTLNIAKDDFVVLELESLMAQPELFTVVTTQVINAITQDVYLSDRGVRRFVIFDEAHIFMKDGGGKTKAIADVIEVGYRRMRKYGASMNIITQAVTDTLGFGPVGRVIMLNSAWKFYLQSDDYPKAAAEKLIDYPEFTMHLLHSIKSNKGKYSGIFMDTPFGQGIGRLIKDRFNYYVNTSDSDDIARLEKLHSLGYDYADSISILLLMEKGTPYAEAAQIVQQSHAA